MQRFVMKLTKIVLDLFVSGNPSTRLLMKKIIRINLSLYAAVTNAKNLIIFTCQFFIKLEKLYIGALLGPL